MPFPPIIKISSSQSSPIDKVSRNYIIDRSIYFISILYYIDGYVTVSGEVICYWLWWMVKS